jgi:hypothetical protein
MRKESRPLRPVLALTLALFSLVALPAIAAAAPRRNENVDVCVVERLDGLVVRTLVYRDVPPLTPGQVIPLRGIYFSRALVPLPFEGSAVMASDGKVRLGVFVHTSARRSDITIADFLLSGETDTTFAGVLHYKNDGEIYPSSLLALEPEDCAAVSIP